MIRWFFNLNGCTGGDNGLCTLAGAQHMQIRQIRKKPTLWSTAQRILFYTAQQYTTTWNCQHSWHSHYNYLTRRILDSAILKWALWTRVSSCPKLNYWAIFKLFSAKCRSCQRWLSKVHCEYNSSHECRRKCCNICMQSWQKIRAHPADKHHCGLWLAKFIHLNAPVVYLGVYLGVYWTGSE